MDRGRRASVQRKHGARERPSCTRGRGLALCSTVAVRTSSSQMSLNSSHESRSDASVRAASSNADAAHAARPCAGPPLPGGGGTAGGGVPAAARRRHPRRRHVQVAWGAMRRGPRSWAAACGCCRADVGARVKHARAPITGSGPRRWPGGTRRQGAVPRPPRACSEWRRAAALRGLPARRRRRDAGAAACRPGSPFCHAATTRRTARPDAAAVRGPGRRRGRAAGGRRLAAPCQPPAHRVLSGAQLRPVWAPVSPSA